MRYAGRFFCPLPWMKELLCEPNDLTALKGLSELGQQPLRFVPETTGV
jgi:hypothetical protein